MRLGRASVLSVLLAVWLLVGSDLAAQEVRGRVIDTETGGPVVGAMVLALDPSGEARTRTLADDRGDFVLRGRTPPGGSYQVVRIGYASQSYPASALGPDSENVLRVASSPIELDGIGVVADDLCGERFEGSALVYGVWLETRKALEMTRLTQARSSLAFEAETILRVLDPRDLVERERVVEPRRLRGETPYYSLDDEQMTEGGWVGTDDDGNLLYWAPDATALLSRAFEEQHCFGAELRADRTVLRFAPNRERRAIPDIEGEIVLDRRTQRLERLSFTYTSLPLPREAQGRASGEVLFYGAPNGMWVVRQWWIRMPVVSVRWRDVGPRAIRTARVDELREQGGRILRIDTGREVVDLTVVPPA